MTAMRRDRVQFAAVLAALFIGCSSANGQGGQFQQGPSVTASQRGSGSASVSQSGVGEAQTLSVDAGSSEAGTSSSPSGDAQGSASGFRPASGPQAARAAELFQQGAAAYQRNDFQTAVRAFEQAYQLAPSSAMAFNVARVHGRLGNVEEAVRYYNLVLRDTQDPAERADIERRIAEMQAYAARRREGISQSLPSDSATAAEARTWFSRGVAFYRRRQYRQAQMAFEQAYVYTQAPDLLFNMAHTYEALHNCDRAIELYQEYLNSRRDTAEATEIEAHIRQLRERCP